MNKTKLESLSKSIQITIGNLVYHKDQLLNAVRNNDEAEVIKWLQAIEDQSRVLNETALDLLEDDN